MQAYLEFFLWGLAVVAVLYRALPLVIRFGIRMAAHPAFEAIDFRRLSHGTAEFLLARIKCLIDLGFDEPILVRMPNPVPNVSTYLIMLINRSTGDKAMVTAIFGTAPGAPQLKTLYVEFSTRFETGEVFDTLNSSELSAFPPGPETVRTQTPSVGDPQKLFRLHQFVMKKHGASGRKVVYGPGQALNYLKKTVLIESYEKQVDRGWLYYDDAADAYRPTLQGAYLMTWSLMQPFKAIRAVAMRRRAWKTLDEFGQAGETI
ncbi:MAG: hypothetical protein HY000_09795 [Planctomycetes bacterium]|nr:hypothetical protein [Planctomycetota bacterium]